MASIVRREPRVGWGLLDLRDEMSRMFRDLFEDWESRTSGWVPTVDIQEEKDSVKLTAELPGVDKKDVNISIKNNVLTIEGEKKFGSEKKQEDYYRAERFYGKFSRSFVLPSEVDTDKVAADFTNGVLTVTLPKSEKVKPRQIEIK